MVRVKIDDSGVDIATVAAEQPQASVDYPAIVWLHQTEPRTSLDDGSGRGIPCLCPSACQT